MVYDNFSEFGNIVSAKVSIDSHYTSKGYGYVQFEVESSAAAAIEKVSSISL